MAWNFGDSFDLYAAFSDMYPFYWDSLNGSNQGLVAGRFPPGRCMQWATTTTFLTKVSGVNDAVHHFVLAFQQQQQALTGSTLGIYLTLFDGATAQCSVVFRQDGAILFTLGGPNGTVLGTYTGAVTLINTWYAFEFEIVINNTTGSFAVRKNGNLTNDFALSGLNTRVSANNYANGLNLGMQGFVGYHNVDDFYWRSDASSVPWIGDVRCYARMPATDVSVQFTRSASTMTIQAGFSYTTWSVGGSAFYSGFSPPYSGTIGAATFNLNNGITGHVKAVIYDSSGPGGAPGIVLGTAALVTNPVTNSNALTFSPPVTVVKGQTYYLGLCADVGITWTVGNNATPVSYYNTISYAAFPATNPSLLTAQGGPMFTTFTITVSRNADFVGESQQDALASYVSDNTVGHADLYTVASIPTVPVNTIAVTTRALVQKSDAGGRRGAVQLKSGSTTVQSPAPSLTVSAWVWLFRVDVNDPSTGIAWTAAGVNGVQIGPIIVS